MDTSTLPEDKIAYISQSISNFKEKILKRVGLPEYQKGDKKHLLLFGLYRPKDYLLYLFHRRRITVIWCGSDILHFQKRWWIRPFVRLRRAKHICENDVERDLLRKYDIHAEVKYIFYENPDNFPVSFKPSKTPHVFLHCHAGKDPDFAARQSGLDVIEKIARKVPEVTFHIYGRKIPFHQVYWTNGTLNNRDYVGLPNVVYHGHVPKEQFNKEIKNYHAGLRLHKFDGCSEVMAKSILLGQYPITQIYYPYIDQVSSEEELIRMLKNLCKKDKPNPARNYWYHTFQYAMHTL